MRSSVVAFAATLVLQTSSAWALDVPTLTGRIVDLADIMPPEREAALTSRLADFEASDSTQIAVLTIPGLEGEALETYSIRVAEKWQIGHQGSDNGVLVLVAMAEHDIRIEVGYGLEGRLPDITAGRIIRNEMTPLFKDGDYAGGIERGIGAIIEAVRGEYKGTGQPTGSLSRENPGNGMMIFVGITMLISAIAASISRLLGGAIGAAGWVIGGCIFLGLASWLLILLLTPVLFGAGMISPELLRVVLSARSGGGSVSRSGGGGGGFSGGGGHFGGGGASGRW